jgi:hypothetical protein
VTALLGRLRLSRLELILAVVAVAVVGLDLILIAGYTAAEEQRDRLQRQVAAVESSMSTMRRPDDLETLKREVADIEARLVANPETFPKEIDNLGINALIANAASQTGVEISKRETGAQATERFGNNEYRSAKYSIVARGDLKQVMLFLNKIETSAYSTLVVNGQSATLQNNVWSIQIDMTAYAQKG